MVSPRPDAAPPAPSGDFSYGRYTLADFYDVDVYTDTVRDQFFEMHLSWEQDRIYQYRRVRVAGSGPRVTLAAKDTGEGEDVLVFAGNDYFGMAQDPEVKRAVKDGIDRFGISSTGSSPTTGLTSAHVALERQLAHLFGKEAALLFNSGFAVNIGSLAPLTKGALVLCDRLCHSSVQDGLRLAALAGADVHYFRHNDMLHLEQLLRQHRGQRANAVIVSEDCFSMDGDYADLDGILRLKRKYQTKVYLDCAHGFGVLDPQSGEGLYAGLPEVDYIMVTFSKLAGAIGGALISDIKTIKYLTFLARSQMFSVSMPPAICLGVSKALSIYQTDLPRRARLLANIAYFRDGLVRLGVASVKADHASPIFPVVISDERRMSSMTEVLLRHGIMATPIVYPAVSRGKCRFRFTVTATHQRADLDRALAALAEAFSATTTAGAGPTRDDRRPELAHAAGPRL